MDFAPFVVGVGLVSPAGFAAAEHAFFVRASLVQPVPSPFLDANDEPIPSMYCAWLPPDSALAARIEQLALSAATEALESVVDERRVHLSLVLSAPSADFTEGDAAGVAARLKGYLGAADVSRFRGAAGAHQALLDARQRLKSGTADAVCIVGSDSSFSVERIAEAGRRHGVVWVPPEPPPSEAAGAVLLSSTRSPSRKPLARFLDAQTTVGAATDHNDEPADGMGLTFLFRRLPNRGGVPMVFGPTESERLRRRDWDLASARVRIHLGAPYVTMDVEEAIGRVGAAAGCVHLAYAIACNRHQTIHPEVPPGSPFYTWAISADGLRGVALFEGAAS